ncbi:MAG: 1-(5-phosphoribosyl)-5-[(5-phosphoribosylamino)methylideneamino]imidazole-4-carboxamide isomerase [Actinomycetota bacterium]
MIIYPAIDIKDGRCVRLQQGKETEVTVYDEDPVRAALRWQKKGADIVHVVDLDGAFRGVPKNAETVRKIVQALDIPVQFGGGVRTFDAVRDLIETGVGHVVLGTVALMESTIFHRAVEEYGERIVVGLDGHHGTVSVEGWTKDTGEDIVEVGKAMVDAGVARIIYTDIARDGMLFGPNIEATRALARAVRIPVTASGGVSSLDDIRALKTLEADGVEGVIIGKALYEKTFTLEEALKVAGDAG